MTSSTSIVAWIFLAVDFWEKDDVTHEELIHSADAIYLAVPTDQEVEFAIAALVRFGLLQVSDGLFSITPAGRSMLEAAHQGAGNVYDIMTALEARLPQCAV